MNTFQHKILNANIGNHVNEYREVRKCIIASIHLLSQELQMFCKAQIIRQLIQLNRLAKNS